MKNRNLLSLLLMFVISTISYGQDTSNQIVKSGSKYTFNNKLYTKKELGEVIKDDKLAWNYYKKYENSKSVANVFGVTTGILGVVGIAAVIHVNSQPETPNSDFDWITAFIPISLSMVTATGFAIAHISVSNNFAKAKDIYNAKAIDKAKMGLIPMELNIQLSNNGLGLVLNF